MNVARKSAISDLARPVRKSVFLQANWARLAPKGPKFGAVKAASPLRLVAEQDFLHLRVLHARVRGIALLGAHRKAALHGRT